MMEITRESDGFSFKVVPVDAIETSDVRLVDRWPASERPTAAANLKAILASVIAAFPLIGELDLSRLHDAYKIIPAGVRSSIMFKPGEQYRVTIVSDSAYEIDVVAT